MVEPQLSSSPPRWDLSAFFAAHDDRALRHAVEAAAADVERLVTRYDQLGIRRVEPRPPGPVDHAALAEVLEATNGVHRRMRPLTAQLAALVATDSRDELAAALHAELQTCTAALTPLSKRLEAWVAALGAEALSLGSDIAGDHRFHLHKAARGEAFQMGEDAEQLAAELAPSAGLAWQRLHGDITSQLEVHLATATGEQRVPMAVARGCATHADPAVRRAAYDAELAAWRTVAVPLAAALNGVKGEQLVLNRRRGYPDDLAPVLAANNVERTTLEAMFAAVEASLPTFRRYLRTKATLLGHDVAGTGEGLPWWDLFAPIGHAEPVPWPVAAERVQHSFARFSPALGGLAGRAFGERWIDAEPRDGKRGGAFCVDFGGDISRVMMNYDGSSDAASTLAHELGHAFHNVQLAERTPLQRRTPMALAETASIFCETLLFTTSMAEAANDAERLSLLDTYLVGATQVVVDIRSRFLFEAELCRRRARTTLSVNDLCELMSEAQEASYGNGVHRAHRHPFMWAVKGHYFTPFYNWPYTFGLLFGLGLFARFEGDPDGFRAGYDDLLGGTGMADAAPLAAGFGIDIADERFWASSLAVLEGHVERYVALAAV